ncbi:MAG: DUF1679 domain-containing protein [SAR202 cluster bacterium]|nr:DUF1679 domain-containing protein [SAR202 cluster bacterium]|tara:strand:- start:22292 stop:23383 length:1092 start_codon:yes stop_codon:yes gene_type:complete
MSNIPINKEDISVRWLTDRLSNFGYCSIDKLQIEVMTGHNPHLSQLFRIRIEYLERTTDHPDVVVLKIPPENDNIRLREAALGPYDSEAGCYRLLKEFQGFNLPRVYSLTQDSEESTACFIFEDIGAISKGCRYPGLGCPEILQVLEFIAAYQSRFWLDESLSHYDWIRDSTWSYLFNQNPMKSILGWQAISQDHQIEKTEGLIVAGEFLSSRLIELMEVMNDRPNTLTHNDLHHGNILLRKSHGLFQPVLIDWQLAAYAGGTNDLAKFLMTSVPFYVLLQREKNLVRYFVDCLQGNGITDYSFDECWRDYRRAQVMVLANYAISGVRRSPNGKLGISKGDSTTAVIRAFEIADPQELVEILP